VYSGTPSPTALTKAGGGDICPPIQLNFSPQTPVPPTKYVYIKSTTVYVPSSELGLSPADEGLEEFQFRRLEKA
jgi:hypothetical protein